MLVRLLYASRARQAIDAATLDAILATSLERNPRHGITGVLCHGNGVFLQALEGERQEVSRLFQAIARDPRHHDVVLLHYEDICQRDFAGWAMGHVNAARINTATLLKFSRARSWTRSAPRARRRWPCSRNSAPVHRWWRALPNADDPDPGCTRRLTTGRQTAACHAFLHFSAFLKTLAHACVPG